MNKIVNNLFLTTPIASKILQNNLRLKFAVLYRYIKTLEWIIIYSYVPITFHVITNTDSKPFVEKVQSATS